MKQRREGPKRAEILAQKRRHYQANKIAILVRNKAHYEANRDAYAEHGRAYRAANLTEIRRKKAEYRAKNVDRIAEKKRREYLRDRDKILERRRGNPEILAYHRKYAKKNRHKIAVTTAKYLERNAERVKAARRAYREAHKAERAWWQRRRQARKKGNGGSHTVKQWLAKCAECDWRCTYCGRQDPLTQDHDIPLSKGGTDDIWNVVPACASCNSSKCNRTGDEYRRWFNKRAEFVSDAHHTSLAQ